VLPRVGSRDQLRATCWCSASNDDMVSDSIFADVHLRCADAESTKWRGWAESSSRVIRGARISGCTSIIRASRRWRTSSQSKALNGGSRKGEDERSAELIAKYGFGGDRRIGQPPGESDRIVARPSSARISRRSRTWCRNSKPATTSQSISGRGAQSCAACGRDGEQVMAVEYDPALINKVFEVTDPVEVKA